MACLTRYADAWQYAADMCVEAYYSGLDNSGGAGNAFLTDTLSVDFAQVAGVRANVGITLFNLTQDTNGTITAVTAHTITAAGVTWDDGDEYAFSTVTAQQRAYIERALERSAGMINLAIQSAGACDCDFSAEALSALEHLNIVMAAAFYACKCGSSSVVVGEVREQYQRWAQEMLTEIRDGRLELCDGETGSGFPAMALVERALTPQNVAEIIRNRMLRESS
jgi:hypothetical protein